MGNEMGNRNISGLQEQNEIEDPGRSSEASMALNDSDSIKEDIQLVTSLDSEDFQDNHKTLSSSVNPSGVIDHENQIKTSDGREEEETMNSSLNTTSPTHKLSPTESVDLKSNEHETTFAIPVESSVVDSSELPGSIDAALVEPDGSCDLKGKGEKLEGAIVDEGDEFVTPISPSEVLAMNNICGKNVEVSDEIDGGMGLSDMENEGEEEEEQPTELNLVEDDSTNSQLEFIPSTKLNGSSDLEPRNSDTKTFLHHMIETGNSTEILVSEKYGEESEGVSKMDKTEIPFQESTAIFPTYGDKMEDVDDGLHECGSETALPVDEAKAVENGYEIDLCDYKPISISEEYTKILEEEMEMVGIATFVAELALTDTDHEVTLEGEDDGSCDELENNEIKGEMVPIGSLSLSDSIEKNVCEEVMEIEQGLDVQGQSAEIVELMDGGIEDQLKENEPNKAVISEVVVGDMDKSEIAEPVLFQSNPIEQMILVQPYHFSLDQSQFPERKGTSTKSEDPENEGSSIIESNQGSHTNIESLQFDIGNPAVKSWVPESENPKSAQDPSLSENQMAQISTFENSNLITTSVHESQEQQNSSLMNYPRFHDSHFNLKTLENSEVFITESNQEKPTTESRTSSFKLENQIEESEVSALQSPNEEFEQSQLLHQQETANCEVFESCGNKERSSTESNQQNEVNAITITSFEFDHQVAESVPSMLIATNGTEESDQNTSFHQAKTDAVAIEVCDSENLQKSGKPITAPNQELNTIVDATCFNFENPIVETEASPIVSSKEESVQTPLLHQEKSVESEVLVLQRSDSGKLRTPLLRYFKEETQLVEPLEKPVKKAVNQVLKSPAEKISATSPNVRGRHKARSSLFSNCMCCTTVIH